MGDVALGLEPVERGQVVAHDDPLAELPQLPAVELLAQLGLADENDLQELALVGLEVREQTHLLEELGVEVLRLVDEQDDVVTRRGLVEEKAVQNLQVRRPVELPRLEAQLREDRPHQLRCRDHRVQDERRLVGRAELGQDRPADRGLARAHLSGDLDEPLAFPDAEENVVERLAMLVREEEEPGIGRYVERRLAEAVEVVVHRAESLAVPAPPRAPARRRLRRDRQRPALGAGVVAGLEGLRIGVEPDRVRLDERLDSSARRVAVVLAGRVAQVAHARGGEPLESLGMRALDPQERALVARPAEGVLAEAAVAPYDTVARDQERHGILRQRRPRGAHGVGMPDLLGDPAVGPHFPRRDLEGLQKHRPFELGEAAQVEVQLPPPLAFEVAHERPHRRRRHRLLRIRPAAVAPLEGPLEVRTGSGPRHHRDPRLAVRHEDGAQRRLETPVGVGQADPPKDRRQQRLGRPDGRRGHRPKHLRDGQRLSHLLHDLTPSRRDSERASRRALIPRCTFDLTVPSGCPRTVATSSRRRPST